MQILQISNDGHKNQPKHVVVRITLFNLQDTEQYKLIKKGTKHTYFEVSQQKLCRYYKHFHS